LGLALDEPEVTETASQINGISVLIADDVKAYADNATVDYGSSRYGEGFTIGAGHSCC
jgi:Fe-S cluster assembly iron-binding protein IscA